MHLKCGVPQHYKDIIREKVCVGEITRITFWFILYKSQKEWVIYGGGIEVHQP